VSRRAGGSDKGVISGPGRSTVLDAGSGPEATITPAGRQGLRREALAADPLAPTALPTTGRRGRGLE
jgi:hypothetical protein